MIARAGGGGHRGRRTAVSRQGRGQRGQSELHGEPEPYGRRGAPGEAAVSWGPGPMSDFMRPTCRRNRPGREGLKGRGHGSGPDNTNSGTGLNPAGTDLRPRCACDPWRDAGSTPCGHRACSCGNETRAPSCDAGCGAGMSASSINPFGMVLGGLPARGHSEVNRCSAWPREPCLTFAKPANMDHALNTRAPDKRDALLGSAENRFGTRPCQGDPRPERRLRPRHGESVQISGIPAPGHAIISLFLRVLTVQSHNLSTNVEQTCFTETVSDDTPQVVVNKVVRKSGFRLQNLLPLGNGGE